MKKKIVHQLSLVGIGGVQSSFIPFINTADEKSSFSYEIFSNHTRDTLYKNIKAKFYNLRRPISILKFLFRLNSKKCVIHFYNNLGSQKLYLILKFFPSRNIIFHERGTCWNIPSSKKNIILTNAKKASVIIVNFEASKQLLVQKFNVDADKIKVIQNGFLGNHILIQKGKKEKKILL